MDTDGTIKDGTELVGKNQLIMMLFPVISA